MEHVFFFSSYLSNSHSERKQKLGSKPWRPSAERLFKSLLGSFRCGILTLRASTIQAPAGICDEMPYILIVAFWRNKQTQNIARNRKIVLFQTFAKD